MQLKSSFLFTKLTLLAFIFCLVKTQNPEPTDNYPIKITLKSPDLIYLYSKYENSEITFELHYKNTTKWVLFGLRGSNYSDIVYGWLNEDGTGHFADSKLSDQNILTVDSHQDWLLKDAYSQNNYKILKFKRKIMICDSTLFEDLDIQTGTNRIVYAYGQLVDDNDGKILDFNSSSLNYINQLVLLLGADTPFTCETKPTENIFLSQPTGFYSNFVDLVDNGIYRFYWNFTSTDLIGEIHVKTNGWVAFGLSPYGGMDKSDVIVGWIDDNTRIVNFTDRYIQGKSVLIDNSQDWKLLYSAQTNGYTVFKFTRPIISCDLNDRSIESGSPFIIFSYDFTDPAPGNDISYHGSSRGTKVINLISGSNTKDIDIPNVETFEYSVNNVFLPKSSDTFYYCKMIEIPSNLTQKRHILKWELSLPKLNFQNMHHLVIYECYKSYTGMPSFTPGECFSNPIRYTYCQKISLTWAYGGDFEAYYPKDTGYPIGGDTDYKYIVMEIHYNNPNLEIGYIEYFKMKYFMTTNLQKNELGVFTIGADMDPFAISIPPKVSKFSLNTYCYRNCMNKYLSQQNMTIIAAGPHTHLTGNAVYTKIIRNGTDIGYLFNNKYYDFNYQQYYLLNPPVNLTKDDDLITHCTYSTVNREKFTNVGLGTKDEMCLHFLLFYPRNLGFSYCASAPYFGEVANLLQDLNITGQININQFNKSSYGDVYESYYNGFLGQNSNYNLSSFGDQFVEFYNKTKVVNYCNDERDFMTQYDQIRILNPYVEPPVCRVDTNSTTATTITNYRTTTRSPRPENIFTLFWNWLISLFW